MSSSPILTHFHKHNCLRVNREKPAIVLGDPPKERLRERKTPLQHRMAQAFRRRFPAAIRPLRPSAGLLALTEYRPDGGNRCDQPDESECRTDSLSLLYTEAVREK